MSTTHSSPVSALFNSSIPPTLNALVTGSWRPPSPQIRISIVPPTPAMPTLPPGVRAARMFKTVRQVAARMARRLPRHVDMEDLVGAGALGLADAFSRRNGMPGSEFEAFASYRIRGAMLDELRRLDAMPRRTRTRAKEVAKARNAVEQRSGTAAADDDIAKELGLELPAYHAMRGKLESSRGPVCIAPPGNDEDETVHEFADAKGETPDVIVARAQIGELIVEGINTLPERMRRVLVGLYVEGETLKEIGAALGVSESRVCQIHTEVLAILRSRFQDDDGDAPPASGARTKKAAPAAQERAQACRRRSA